MKYAEQVQIAMDRLDESLFKLRDLIKRGEQKIRWQGINKNIQGKKLL